MIVFAVVLLFTVGFFNVIDGIAAIANSHVFIANAHYVIGDLRAWGWVALILGALQVLAAIGVLAANSPAGSDFTKSAGAPQVRCLGFPAPWPRPAGAGGARRRPGR